MTKNSIPALTALTRMQESAYSGQQAIGGGHGIKVTHEKSSVSFTVLASNAQNVVLQDNANKQRFNLPSAALNGAKLPNSGDTLILVSANERQLNFRLVPQQTAQSLTRNGAQTNALPTGLTRALVASWPEVSATAASKAPLSIAAQMPVNAGDPKLAALAKILSYGASKTGQPLIELPISGKVSAIQNPNTANATALIKLAMANAGSKDLNMVLPLPAKIASSIKAGTSVEVLLSPNQKGAAIQGVTIKSVGALNRNDLQNINIANPQLNTAIKQIAQQLLFKGINESGTAASKTSGMSGTQNIIYPLQKQVLNALPQGFASQINSAMGNNVEQVNEARLVIAPQQILSKQSAQTSNAASQLMLMAVAKPQMMQVLTEKLSTDATKHMILDDAVSPNTKPQAQGGIDAKGTEAKNVGPSKAANKNAAPVAMNDLLTQIQKKLPASEIANLSPKLQQALNHTLTHTAPSAPVMSDIKTTLENTIANGRPETRALLKPLLQQLQTILGTNGASTNEAEPADANTKQTDKVLNSYNQANKAPESDLKVAELLRSTIGAQAVTQISNNSQSANNNFIEGLVTLLKLSLAAKLANSTAGVAPRLAQEIPPNIAAFASSVVKQNNPRGAVNNTPRILQDITLGDPRASLISGIGKLLSSHNTHKLRSAEASLQGQDTYYYALPNVLNPQNEDIEIAIKREHSQNEKDQEKQGGSTWKLDMKLDIGDQGTVLAKTQFTSIGALAGSDNKAYEKYSVRNEKKKQDYQGIDLHLYTSNEALKDKVLKYLPMLLERLESLGIEVKSQKCDVGKVDVSLFKTQLNVMHAYA